MRRIKITAGILVSLISSMSLANEQASSKENAKARWEYGVGIGTISLPDYLGSKQQSSYILPTPYVVYHGEYLKADRKGLRATLWENQPFELTLSVNFSLPVKSDDNNVRSGMPNLKPLFELGPSLNYSIFNSEDEAHSLSFQLPVRAAYNFEQWKPQQQGLIASPQLKYQYISDEWKGGLSYGPIYANEQYHDYFYQVDPQFSTGSRAEYNARKGHIANRLTANFSRRFKDWYIGGFFRYYDLSHAANLDSPLIETKHNYSAGFVVTWVFGHSD